MKGARVIGLVVMTCGACIVNSDFDDTAFRCERSDACPGEMVCRNNRCVAADAPLRPGIFARRLEARFDGPAVANFPLLVVLDGTRIDYATAGDAGESLRFTDERDELLAFEIESWNSDGSSVVWVEVPLLNGEGEVTAFNMYWGAAMPPSTAPATDVWDSDYVAVWHLDDDPRNGESGAILDSTANRHHGTASSSMDAASLESSPIGVGLYFDDGDDAVVFGDKPEFELSPYSYSFLVRGDVSTAADTDPGQPIFNADGQFNFSWTHPNETFTQSASHRSAEGFVPARIDSGLEAAIWYPIGVSYDSQSLRIYLDGAESGLAELSPPVPEPGPLAIGNDPDVVRFAGALDEVRISKIARPPAWFAAMSASYQADFISFGALQEL